MTLRRYKWRYNRNANGLNSYKQALLAGFQIPTRGTKYASKQSQERPGTRLNSGFFLLWLSGTVQRDTVKSDKKRRYL